MTSYLRSWVFGLVLAVAVAGAVMGANSNQPQPWWKSSEFIKGLGLTADQSARVDAIFQSTRPDLMQEMEELDRRELKLTTMIDQDEAEAVVIRQIDRVESARANVAKTRQIMYYRMRNVLSRDQRKVFEEIWARRQAQTPQAGPGRQGLPTSGQPPGAGQRNSSQPRPSAPPR